MQSFAKKIYEFVETFLCRFLVESIKQKYKILNVNVDEHKNQSYQRHAWELP